MSTAFGLNLFLLSHLSVSRCREVGALLQAALSPPGLGALLLCSAALGSVHVAACPGWGTLQGHGEGERLVCRAAPKTHSTRVTHGALVSAWLGSSLWSWIAPVASKLRCELLAAAVAGLCASLDPWPCLS